MINIEGESSLSGLCPNTLYILCGYYIITCLFMFILFLYEKCEGCFLLKLFCGKERLLFFNLFTPVCNDGVTQLLCQALCNPQWIKRSLWRIIFQDPVTVLFPAIVEARGKYLLIMADRGRLDIPDLSRTRLLAEANPSFLLHCLWGHLARGDGIGRLKWRIAFI